jgi:hypothetical protein
MECHTSCLWVHVQHLMGGKHKTIVPDLGEYTDFYITKLICSTAEDLCCSKQSNMGQGGRLTQLHKLESSQMKRQCPVKTNPAQEMIDSQPVMSWCWRHPNANQGQDQSRQLRHQAMRRLNNIFQAPTYHSVLLRTSPFHILVVRTQGLALSHLYL